MLKSKWIFAEVQRVVTMDILIEQSRLSRLHTLGGYLAPSCGAAQ